MNPFHLYLFGKAYIWLDFEEKSWTSEVKAEKIKEQVELVSPLPFNIRRFL